MIREFSSGLLLPALALGLLGWLVPRLLARLLARVWPEGVGPVLLLGFVATLLLLVLATGFFALLYAWQGAPLGEFFRPGAVAGLGYFARLGLLSALVWAPILVLSVAGLPRHWKEKVW